MGLPAARWAEMTTRDLQAADASWVAVLPTAAVEQHGPHLPLGTDMLIGEGMVETVIARLPEDLPATFLPVQAIGKSNEHIAFPGTLTLEWDTVVKAWVEIGASVARAGVRRLVVVNSHGGNTALLDVVTRELRVRFDMLAVHTAWFRFGDADLAGEGERAVGIHGGTLETALVQHFRPDLVRAEHVADFQSTQSELAARFRHLRAHGPHAFAWKAGDLNADGVVGDARAATPEAGARLAQHQAALFIELLREVAAIDLAVLR